MKKTLTIILCVMMMVGSAVSSSAASLVDLPCCYDPNLYSIRYENREADRQIAFLGYNDVFYVGLGKFSGLDSYFVTDSFILNINMVFHPADENTPFWRLRTPNFKRFNNTSWTDRSPLFRFRSVLRPASAP